jgi:hypothetical protein
MITNMFVHATQSRYTCVSKTAKQEHIKTAVALFNKRLTSIIVITVLSTDNGWAIGD